LWFLILPSTGIYFAWPVKPELTAIFTWGKPKDTVVQFYYRTCLDTRIYL